LFDRIFQDLESGGFRDVAGARASVTIPIPESLLNRVVAAALPPAGAVRELSVTPEAGNRFLVRVRLAKPAFLPALKLNVSIERQPDFPRSPVLELRIAMPPLLAGLAGAAQTFVDVLPPGVEMQGDRVLVNLAALAERQGHGRYLRFVQRVEITTDPGRLNVAADVRVPEGTAPRDW
jgi:hypothetical protein